MADQKNIPQHVAIIMDGNGRWAKSRGLPKIAGHREGAKRVDEIVKAAAELGIKAVTLYAFSTENWKRPKAEVEGLFALLGDYLDKEEARLNKDNIRFSVIGRIEGLPKSLQAKLNKAIESTKNNTATRLNLALNYGARSEIIDAVRKIAEDVKSGKLASSDIDENKFSSYLYTHDLPDPDLLIRTSGEYRVSNFLLWQISYAEIYITETLWPDFTKEELQKAILDYQNRERRFGG